MSVLNEASDVALEAMLLLNGEAVTYRRGSVALSFDAVQGVTEWDEIEPTGIATVTVKRHDWLYKLAELGLLGKPQEGDTVTHVTESGTRVHTVMRGAPGEQAWRFMDRGRKWIRTHTVQTT